MTRIIFSLLAIFSLSACPPAHVQLQDVPDRTAPMQERLEAYNHLAPAYAHKLNVIVRAGPNGNYAGTQAYTEFIQLEDGRRVWVAHDLKPAVDPDSATAKAIADEDFHNEKTKVWGWVAAGTMGTGLAVFSIGPFLAYLPSIAFGRPQGSMGPFVPATIAALGVAIGAAGGTALVPYVHHAQRRSDARARAFQNFHRDLRTHLGLKPLPTRSDLLFGDVDIHDGTFDIVPPSSTEDAHGDTTQTPDNAEHKPGDATQESDDATQQLDDAPSSPPAAP